MNLQRTLLGAIGIASALAASATATDDGVQFNRDVRPILSDKCFQCHGQDAAQRQAKLRLDVEASAKAIAIVAGAPAKSKLIERIASADPDVQMPPPDSGKKLSAAEIQVLTRWIAEGAKFETHWAYVPPQRHAIPPVRDGNWSTHWIDRFILHRLEAVGLAPSSDADPATLLRRLSFDLTGLPPSPAEVDAFIAASSVAKTGSQPLHLHAALEGVVDRLLASDRFGERMASYWLDLVRYADTVGYHGDQDHNISPYRDWVIDAFNDNVPFDRFTRDQLAGDLAPGAGIDGKIASGYNRLLQTSHEGGVQAKEYLAIYGADRVRNLSAVWLGATLGCAQCHDHKYDPFTARDFYSMQAFFADLDEARHLKKGSDSLPTVREPEIGVLTKRERKRLGELRQQRDAASGAARAALDKEIAGIEKNARKTMVSVAIAPRPIRILPRGNWLDDSGPVVDPAVPAFLGKLELPAGSRPTRLDLANWLTDPKHGIGGLTARVLVNRLWSLFFDAGLARSLEDFGGQGEPPIHPELLDQLAIDLYEHGWDVKRAIKQIVLTRTYRQSSTTLRAQREKDPSNRWFGRQASGRLPAEMLRDNALAAAGLLVLDYGGASARPYQPEGYYRHLNFPKRTYKPSDDRRQWRRGVYVHWQRQFLHPMLRAFDAPSREECTAKRPPSNTPLAALVLLNDPTFVEAARGLAARVLHEAPANDAARIRFAYLLAAGRAPTSAESTLLTDLLASERKACGDDAAAAAQLLRTGLSPVPQDIPAPELAAWTAVARALLSADATTMRR